MAHTSEKRWNTVRSQAGTVVEGVNTVVGRHAEQVLKAINDGNELYAQLLEMFTFAGGTDQLMANLLFRDEIAARGDTEANAEELQMATDLKDATVALNQLYLAMTGETVAAVDRASSLRRMV